MKNTDNLNDLDLSEEIVYMKGFVNINKPLGMTSSDVVVKVRGILRRASGEKQKVGHLGTLDPQGSGVLPIAVGTATRLFDFMQEKRKVYQATFVFGKETDTLDGVGKVVATSDILPQKEQIEAFVTTYHGKIDQVPPQYSAKSVDGRRAYDLARQGVAVELAPKRVNIEYVKLLDSSNGVAHLKKGDYTLQDNEYAFEIACSSGTYIRSIARDVAYALKTVGYMSSIDRVQSGNFRLDDAVTLEEFEKEPLRYLKSVDSVLCDNECYDLQEEFSAKVLNGVKLPFDDMPAGDFLVKYQGEIIAIGENQDGLLRLKTRL